MKEGREVNDADGLRDGGWQRERERCRDSGCALRQLVSSTERVIGRRQTIKRLGRSHLGPVDASSKA